VYFSFAFLFFIIVIGSCLFCIVADAEAGEETAEEIMKGVLSSFSLPLYDLFKKEYPSEWQNLFHGFSGGFAFTYPLKDTIWEDRGPDGQQTKEGFRKATVSASFKYNPISYWYISTTFIGYLDFESDDIWCPDCRAAWDPDFSYSFGYADWHPYTFSLIYSNYGGNRLNPNKEKGEKVTDFKGGSISLGWNFPIPRYIEELFIVHDTGGIGAAVNYNLTPEFMNLESLSEETWKQSISLSLKYTIYKWWYANITFYYYPESWQQQPWDPDFTYGFGYFDWHTGTISIQYNNYSGNRYPWRKDKKGAGTFEDGAITISWSWVY
jgi:hypothetical protein